MKKKYNERLEYDSTAKREIGEYGLHYIKENEVYFFDVSTTIKYLCDYLNKPSKIYIHSIDNVDILANKSAVDVHLLGGKLNKKNRFFFGSSIISQLENIFFDKVFIGVAALRKDGLYFDDEEDAYIKQYVIKRSKKL
ncbi:hypothetical protein [Mammaliicoccus lentus]|jgi:DeoR/GlpR family transcriptional regulator of sugar metabolism|uniref:hypothetical protein n=1 Tax=Mammaliicoccus lentus TaxID=42858 RepID=UPI003514109C